MTAKELNENIVLNQRDELLLDDRDISFSPSAKVLTRTPVDLFAKCRAIGACVRAYRGIIRAEQKLVGMPIDQSVRDAISKARSACWDEARENIGDCQHTLAGLARQDFIDAFIRLHNAVKGQG